MKRIGNIDQKCHRHVVAAQEASSQRDQLLSAAAALLDNRDETVSAMEIIDNARTHQLHKLREQATTITRMLGGTALLAEKASKQVKRLDFLLSRVTQSREIAQALQQQTRNIDAITASIESQDLAAATACVQRYEDAKRLLSTRGVSSGSSSDFRRNQSSSSDNYASDVVVVDKDSIMESAKSELAKMLRSQLSSAIAVNDKLKIVKLTSMLATIGFRDEACEAYLGWISDHTIAQLKTMVSRELRNMDDPGTVGMSHLTLVSNALDHVVAAMEQEQPHVLEAFGSQGHLKLLQWLHSRCTQHCVPVVKDFLEKRKVLTVAKQNNESEGMSPHHKGGKGLLSDPRRTDECLEDISHLVSCCSLYMNFIEAEMTKAAEGAVTHSEHGSGVGKEKKPPRVAALATKDNALFDTIQDLLSIYIPLQAEYFDAAFAQAVKLQNEQLSGNAAISQQYGRNSGANKGNREAAASSSGGIMGALSSLYGGADQESLELAHDHEAAGPALSLVDDVFYFLRIAIHRASGTKSTSILSAVIIAALDVVQSKLIPEIAQHITHQLKKVSSAAAAGGANDSQHSHSHGHFSIPSKALKWLCAAHQCQRYTSKLAEELHQLVMVNFCLPDELVRFSEQRQDVDILAKSMGERHKEWSMKIGGIIASSWMHRTVDRLQSISYVMDEEQFNRNDIVDPWAVAATMGWSHSLDFVEQYVHDEEVRDQILLDVCSRVVRILEEAVLSKKQYNAFGALQLDKDIRIVRQFFMDRTERPIRDIFLRLGAISSLLIVDRPSESAGLYAGADAAFVMSLEEKKRILAMRVDFDAASIAALTS